ncbi:hypothetical protein MRX96_011325 [Rhipicephalus microplus]
MSQDGARLTEAAALQSAPADEPMTAQRRRPPQLRIGGERSASPYSLFRIFLRSNCARETHAKKKTHPRQGATLAAHSDATRTAAMVSSQRPETPFPLFRKCTHPPWAVCLRRWEEMGRKGGHTAS